VESILYSQKNGNLE